MKRSNEVIILLWFLCFLWSHGIPAFVNENTLAVLDFENNSLFNREENQPLSKGLAEMMITELNQVQALRVVERQKLRSLLDEIKLSQSGTVSEASSVRAGKMLGAKHLVFGGYMAMDKNIRIDVRIVEVETGLTVKASEVTGKSRDILSLVKKLSKKILSDLNIRMTKNEIRSLDKSKKMDMQAVVYFSEGLDFEDRRQWGKAREFYQKALKIEPEFEQAKIRIQRLSEKGLEK